MPAARPAAQSGQALLLALLLLACTAAALLHGFNGGQLLRDKTRLAGAADAAAYSGALTQARAFNFLAYANRALVAHQIAMAHAVTLAAWARFGDAQAGRLGSSNPPAALIGALFGPAYGLGYQSAAAARGLNAASEWPNGALARAYAEHDRVTHDILARAQQAVQASLPDARNAVMQAVLTAYDDGDSHLDERMLADDLPGALVRHGGNARLRLKAMVEDAAGEYGFLEPRNATARSLIPPEARCPWLFHELRRRGATSLEGLAGWQATDTESFHALRSNRWIGCYYREYPMGWGAAQGESQGGESEAPAGLRYVDDPPADFADQDFWRWVAQHTDWDILGASDTPLANSYAVAQGVHWPGRGLPGFTELARPGLGGRQQPPLRFAMRVTRAAERLHTTGGLGPRAGAGRLVSDASLPGGVMAAVSAAETFYGRPAGSREGASLFMPYWQARLSPVADAERALAWGRQ